MTPLAQVGVTTGNNMNIPGLTYHTNLLTPEEQQRVLDAVDAQPWRNDLKRRVQHYGYVYDYKARWVDKSMFLGPLPSFITEVTEKLQGFNPDQLIVNEYLPGQGISAHVDCEPCFANTIVTVSLGWPYEMEFTNGNAKETIMLEQGSTLFMEGEARYKWRHQIRPRLNDHGIKRERRVSLTFRNVILGG